GFYQAFFSTLLGPLGRIQVLYVSDLTGVPNRKDENLIRILAVDDPVRPVNHFSKIRTMLSFGDPTPAPGERSETTDGFEDLFDPLLSRNRSIDRNTLRDLCYAIESERGPNDFHRSSRLRTWARAAS